jgi:hypothetical protein
MICSTEWKFPYLQSNLLFHVVKLAVLEINLITDSNISNNKFYVRMTVLHRNKFLYNKTN